MDIKRVIFCLPKDVHIDNFGMMINWAYQNPNADTVLMLSIQEIEQYTELGLWGKISEITGNYLFGYGEDDWLIDLDIILKVRDNIKNLSYDDFNILKIIKILDYAICYKQTVVFYL